MNIFDLFNTSSPTDLIIKVFAVVSSILFLIFAIVLYRQTQIMVRTIHLRHNWVIVLISFIQVIIALILLLIAFFIV